MNINEKLDLLVNTAKEIRDEDEFAGNVFLEGIGLSVNIISTALKLGNRDKIDVSEQIELVSRMLGFSLEDMVKHIIEAETQADTTILATKEADEETLKFITANLDDYEKFLADNGTEKIKDNLNFLSKEI